MSCVFDVLFLIRNQQMLKLNPLWLDDEKYQMKNVSVWNYSVLVFF